MSLLYDHYANSLYGLVRRILGDDQLAEDALQKSMLKIWQSIDSYDAGRATFFTWISVIARNTALDQKRLKVYQAKQKTVSVDDVVYKSEVRMPDGANIDAARLLSNLDENNRIVLEYAYLRGYTQQEISDSLNIPLGTVKTRIRKAISLLRDQLKNEKEYFLGGPGLKNILLLFPWI
ncbi:MAG TPA: sigma-70 family RNA polymerase sigma factor [Saprospiraceae bacterium]|nr:sigma-70 family RNA polymerase sigma factor [Saprospiraceae bacterium]